MGRSLGSLRLRFIFNDLIRGSLCLSHYDNFFFFDLAANLVLKPTALARGRHCISPVTCAKRCWFTLWGRLLTSTLRRAHISLAQPWFNCLPCHETSRCSRCLWSFSGWFDRLYLTGIRIISSFWWLLLLLFLLQRHGLAKIVNNSVVV